MLIPCIDLRGGQAVQLVHGRRRELAVLRKKRNASKVEKCLTALDRATKSSENLMPIIVDCVRNYVTVGEICKVLRGTFGEYRPSHSI